MGRGRAKAKQTKVARELKYHSPNTDLAALQRELGSKAGSDAEDSRYLDEDLDLDADDGDDDGGSDEGDEHDTRDDGRWAARHR